MVNILRLSAKAVGNRALALVAAAGLALAGWTAPANAQGGAMLDKPTFGEKFKLGGTSQRMRAQHYNDELTTGLKGTRVKIQLKMMRSQPLMGDIVGAMRSYPAAAGSSRSK
jgi:hypothetical protein